MYKVLSNLKHSKYKKYLCEKKVHCRTFSSLMNEVNKIYSEQLSQKKIKKNGTEAFKYLKKSAEDLFDNHKLNVKSFFSDGFITDDGHKLNHRIESAYKKKKNKKYTYTDDIFIASSGMGDFGPVKKIISKYINDDNATVLLTGYAPPNTLSGKLKNKEKQITIDNTQHTVNLNIEDMSAYYSAHADQNQLLDFVFSTIKVNNNREATVFINHGPTNEAKETLKRKIIKRSERKNKEDKEDRVIKEVHIANEEWFNLNTGKFDANYNNPCFENITTMIRKLVEDVALIKTLIMENNHNKKHSF
jgi:metallo-beta-lactamase family protein